MHRPTEYLIYAWILVELRFSITSVFHYSGNIILERLVPQTMQSTVSVTKLSTLEHLTAKELVT